MDSDALTHKQFRRVMACLPEDDREIVHAMLALNSKNTAANVVWRNEYTALGKLILVLGVIIIGTSVLHPFIYGCAQGSATASSDQVNAALLPIKKDLKACQKTKRF